MVSRVRLLHRAFAAALALFGVAAVLVPLLSLACIWYYQGRMAGAIWGAAIGQAATIAGYVISVSARHSLPIFVQMAAVAVVNIGLVLLVSSVLRRISRK